MVLGSLLRPGVSFSERSTILLVGSLAGTLAVTLVFKVTIPILQRKELSNG